MLVSGYAPNKWQKYSALTYCPCCMVWVRMTASQSYATIITFTFVGVWRTTVLHGVKLYNPQADSIFSQYYYSFLVDMAKESFLGGSRSDIDYLNGTRDNSISSCFYISLPLLKLQLLYNMREQLEKSIRHVIHIFPQSNILFCISSHLIQYPCVSF